MDFERVGSMKFQAPAGITYEKLVTNARNELRSEHPETYSCSCCACVLGFVEPKRTFISGRS